MAITEERIVAIETAITTLQEQLKTLVPKLQFNQYVLSNEQELDELKQRLDSAEKQIQQLQGS